MSSPEFKIPLFDIDWTLLEKDKKRNIHDEAFYFAFKKIYGLELNQKVSEEGWIDTQIIFDTVTHHGISEGEAKDKIPRALTAMVDYFMKHASEGNFKTMPGAEELLRHLKSLNLTLALLTGNVEEIAWEKLRLGSIADYFTFGAFGSMALKRVDLIPIAKKRLEEILNEPVPLDRFVIVGDSPLDIACARAGGIPVIAVGAGDFKTHQLKEADLVVESLLEKDQITQFLLN